MAGERPAVEVEQASYLLVCVTEIVSERRLAKVRRYHPVMYRFFLMPKSTRHSYVNTESVFKCNKVR
jgi:hypothetical protein